MGVTRPSDWMKRDSRWKAWGKKISGPEHLDLNAKNGYSLTGPWVGWDESVSLGEGEFLVIASELGSRKDHPYCYGLIMPLPPTGFPGMIHVSESYNAICDHGSEKSDIADAISRIQDIPDEQRARAQNSGLYAMALWMAVWYRHRQQESQPICEDPLPDIPTEDLLKAILARGYTVEGGIG